MTLFCDRAGLAPAPAVDELCRRLDDMPLAVELAAARVKVLPPEQIVERLGQRLDLLKGGRDADPRQATLRATIEWSHDLLDEEEQRLFARLSVFPGCTLDAAEAICGADVDVLQSLVEKSLVRRTDDRFWMLETIREYAGERLAASGEAADIGRRHAEYYRAVAESTCLATERAGTGPIRYDIALAERDNFRAALDWAQEYDPALGLEIAVELEQFWASADPFEAVRRFTALLERAGDAPGRARGPRFPRLRRGKRDHGRQRGCTHAPRTEPCPLRAARRRARDRHATPSPGRRSGDRGGRPGCQGSARRECRAGT